MRHAVTIRPETRTLADDVRRFRRGDARAAERLARTASRLALRTAAALVGNREEAGDISQDVAVDVLRSLHRLREPEAFEAWVHRITVRHALRSLRRRRTAHARETPLALLPELDEPAPGGAADLASLVSARVSLASALAELPPRQRIALALRYVHDLPDAEIAAALRCRPGTVPALLSRGRTALRAHSQLAEFAPVTPGGSG
jgi:RNA polymerase sigma-70 factor (ECF subfamily)